jgi:hypothetical protein
MQNRKLTFLSRGNNVFCSHDAGGANVLSSMIKELQLKGQYLLSGPAESIFQSRISNLKNLRITEIPKNTKNFISSTSYPSKYELNFMLTAQEMNCNLLIILDHWGNFKPRLLNGSELIIPNWFIATDKLVRKKIENLYTQSNIIEVPNYYHDLILKEVKLKKQTVNLGYYDFLFISEPLAKNNLIKKNQDEFDYLREFLNRIKSKKLNSSRILIRMHPSEQKRKYNSLISDFTGISISNNQELSDDLAAAKCVVGISSMALYLSSCCNIQTMTMLPIDELNAIFPTNSIKAFSSF